MDGQHDWAATLSASLARAGVLLRPLGTFPNRVITPVDAQRNANSQIASVLKIKPNALYAPAVLWTTCEVGGPFGARTAADTVLTAMRTAGYRLVTKSTSADRQVARWTYAQKAARRPDVATAMTWKCGADDNLAVLTAFQIGDDRHASYWTASWQRLLSGNAADSALLSAVQLKEPSAPVDVSDGRRAVLAAFFNGNSVPVSVSVQVSERDAAGQVVNVHTNVFALSEPNAPAQVAVPVTGVGISSVTLKVVAVQGAPDQPK